MKRFVSPPAAHLIAIVVLCAGYALYTLALARADAEPASHVESLFRWMLAILLAMWVVADSKGREGIYRPFEFGLFVVIFAIPYLPYYLFKTRGFLGLVWLVGAIALFYVGVFAAWVGGSAT